MFIRYFQTIVSPGPQYDEHFVRYLTKIVSRTDLLPKPSKIGIQTVVRFIIVRIIKEKVVLDTEEDFILIKPKRNYLSTFISYTDTGSRFTVQRYRFHHIKSQVFGQPWDLVKGQLDVQYRYRPLNVIQVEITQNILPTSVLYQDSIPLSKRTKRKSYFISFPKNFLY